MDFKNRSAIITGGTGAVGGIVVRKFFEAGANIAVPVHSKSRTRSLPQYLLDEKDRLILIETDLTVESQIYSFVEQAQRKFGGIDFLANIAGGYAGGNTIAQVSLDEWQSMLSLNLNTAFLMCREVLKLMTPRKFGRIVNIASMPALVSGAKKGPYAISKRAVIALTETIADEVKGSGVTANAIAPGTILTEANKTSMPQADFQKWVTPEEIADLILYLCSDNARSINGNVIKVFGAA